MLVCVCVCMREGRSAGSCTPASGAWRSPHKKGLRTTEPEGERRGEGAERGEQRLFLPGASSPPTSPPSPLPPARKVALAPSKASDGAARPPGLVITPGERASPPLASVPETAVRPRRRATGPSRRRRCGRGRRRFPRRGSPSPPPRSQAHFVSAVQGLLRRRRPRQDVHCVGLESLPTPRPPRPRRRPKGATPQRRRNNDLDQGHLARVTHP